MALPAEALKPARANERSSPRQWPMAYILERNAAAWERRLKGETVESIGRSLPRADGRGVGVTKARAWQIIRGEFWRRALEAETYQEIEALYGQARLRSLRPLRDEALGLLAANGSGD